MKNWTMAVAAVCLASGCTTSTNYTPPIHAGVVNSTKINQPFDSVWDRLVRELSSDFFVINNIDKNSRLINVSFSSNQPSDYVDCGNTSRSSGSVFAGGATAYRTADSATYRTTDQIGRPLGVNRTTRLNGRTNIYVAPEGAGTSVVVNAMYVLDVAAVVTYLNGRVAGQTSNAITFSTKNPSTPTATQPGCTTKGVIENKILNHAGMKT